MSHRPRSVAGPSRCQDLECGTNYLKTLSLCHIAYGFPASSKGLSVREVLNPWTRLSCLRVFTARVHGPWIRAVNTGSVYRPLSWHCHLTASLIFPVVFVDSTLLPWGRYKNMMIDWLIDWLTDWLTWEEEVPMKCKEGHIHCVRKKVNHYIHFHIITSACRILAKFYNNNATSNCKQNTKFQ